MTEYEIKRLEDRIRELWNEKEDLLKENAELKKEIEKHKWNDIFLEDCAGYDKEIAEEYTTLQERIEKLEQQIEKMKCCENCKHKKSEIDRCELLMYSLNACLCKNKDKWELKE